MSKKAFLFVLPLALFLWSCSNNYSNDFDEYWIVDGVTSVESFNEQLNTLMIQGESNEFYIGKQQEFFMFTFQDHETLSGLKLHGKFGYSLKENAEIDQLIFEEFYIDEFIVDGIGSELYILKDKLVLLE